VQQQYEDIEVDWDGGAICTVRLARPTKLNAVRDQTLRELLDVLSWTERQDSVRVVVLTGAGRAFCAGQDLGELGEALTDVDLDAARDSLRRFQQVTRAMLGHSKVLIAALNGVAVGFGAELALACDIRVASTNASIGFVEATRGLFQTNGVLWLLPRIVGHGAAAHLLLTGAIVPAEEAQRLGLVSACLEPSDLSAGTSTLAGTVAGNAPIPVRRIKEVLRTTWDADVERVMSREVDGMLACMVSEDLREGTAAFHEGRRPVYRGR
jgi:enoyl-CoA hydratase/carnithine racemase